MIMVRPFRYVHGKMRRVKICRDVHVGDMYNCEGRFAMRKYVRCILSVIANRTWWDLEQIYTTLGWPDSLESLENILSSPPTIVVLAYVRHGLRNCIGVMELMSWRILNPNVLTLTWWYYNGWCWAMKIIRLFETLLKLNNLLQPHVLLPMKGCRSDLG